MLFVQRLVFVRKKIGQHTNRRTHLTEAGTSLRPIISVSTAGRTMRLGKIYCTIQMKFYHWIVDLTTFEGALQYPGEAVPSIDSASH